MAVKILETTIRDGGYEISHEFTEEDVALVVSTLDAAGVTYVEVGHGMGVGAQLYRSASRPEAPLTGDLAHMVTAKASAKRAKVGVLFVAGERFCPAEYLDEVAAAGMDFVRLAFMPSDVTRENMHYVERARSLGMLVSIQCMQTYILPPDEAARRAALCHSAGAQWWYVVDSAGGMKPGEVREYVRAVRDSCDIEVGLHAHNNLGLAVANSLAAVEEGATLVDCTMNGIGRATGNAPTEQLTLALQTLGHETDIDVEPITRISAMYRTLFEAKGNDPMHMVSGASLLHSRNVPSVVAQASERRLSLVDYLVRVGREARQQNCLDHLTFSSDLFEAAAQGCKPVMPSAPSPCVARAIAERIAPAEHPSIDTLCDELALRSARHHLPSVLHLVPAARFPFERPLPWQSSGFVGASAPWSDEAASNARKPDFLIVDPSIAQAAGLPVAGTRTFACSWQDLLCDAVRTAVALHAASASRPVWVAGTSTPLPMIAERLRSAGFDVGAERPDGCATIVASSSDQARWIPQLARGDLVILVDRPGQAREAVDAIRRARAQAIIPPIGAAVAARAGELVTVAAQLLPTLDARTADAPWVDPLLAPGTGQAVIDVDCASIVVANEQPWDELVQAVASARARTLANGTGRP